MYPRKIKTFISACNVDISSIIKDTTRRQLFWLRPIRSLKDVSKFVKRKNCNGLIYSTPFWVLSVQLLSRVWLLVTPWTATHRASLSISNFLSLLKLMSIESVIPSKHLILCHPLLLLQSLLASGSFPMSHFFASGIGISTSASVLPMNIQDWFSLGWTGWISLQSKGLSRVFSNNTLEKHQFFSAQLSL